MNRSPSRQAKAARIIDLEILPRWERGPRHLANQQWLLQLAHMAQHGVPKRANLDDEALCGLVELFAVFSYGNVATAATITSGGGDSGGADVPRLLSSFPDDEPTRQSARDMAPFCAMQVQAVRAVRLCGEHDGHLADPFLELP